MPIDLFSFLRKKNPCYRCGGDARRELAGYKYCVICVEVVRRMMPVVGYGGMFGFPGADGYLEFPNLQPIVEKKKEG